MSWFCEHLATSGDGAGAGPSDILYWCWRRPKWTAPEIFQGQAYDEKVDVYSFAITAWEMLTGTNIEPRVGSTGPRQSERNPARSDMYGDRTRAYTPQLAPVPNGLESARRKIW